jgi:23S rRNA (guanosine2251-2'-O)-methyltransferase
MKIILNNIRSAWNVGSIMRTCDGIGAELILVGYTPKPIGDSLNLIKKTSIGSENSVPWVAFEHWQEVFIEYNGLKHIAVEISNQSIDIIDFLNTTKINPDDLNNLCLWFGNEISGLDSDLVKNCQVEVNLPMRGIKESLNISNSVTAIVYIIDIFSRLKLT